MSSQIALKEERPFARVTWGTGSGCWEGDGQGLNAGHLWLVFHRTIRGHPSDPSYRTRRVGAILLQFFWEDFPSCCRAARFPPPSLSERPVIVCIEGAKDDSTQCNTIHKVQLIALKGN